MRISRALIINTLCCAVGLLAAWNAAIVYPYRHDLYRIYEEIARCVDMASR
jgi:hypothetical protein